MIAILILIFNSAIYKPRVLKTMRMMMITVFKMCLLQIIGAMAH